LGVYGPYRDKKVVGVFVPFFVPLHSLDSVEGSNSGSTAAASSSRVIIFSMMQPGLVVFHAVSDVFTEQQL
jgi:hypothetical protein